MDNFEEIAKLIENNLPDNNQQRITAERLREVFYSLIKKVVERFEESVKPGAIDGEAIAEGTLDGKAMMDSTLDTSKIKPGSDGQVLKTEGDKAVWKDGLNLENGEGKNSVQQVGGGAKASGGVSVAEGNGAAKGAYSHAEGLSNALGYGSHSEGTSTAMESYDHAEGFYNITRNTAEHAEGKYNVSNLASTKYGDHGNTQHSVGIGTDQNNRKNAFEIMQNGDAYFYGIGEYDGTNPGSAKNLKEVLGDLECNIKELSKDDIQEIIGEELDIYEKRFVINSNQIVTKSAYENDVRATVDGRNFLITCGGNYRSVGCNSNKASICNLDLYPQFKGIPGSLLGITSVFSCETYLENVSSIKIDYSNGANDKNVKVLVLRGDTLLDYNRVDAGSGTISTYNSRDIINFPTPKSGYFALVFTNNSNSYFRLDDVELTFTYNVK